MENANRKRGKEKKRKSIEKLGGNWDNFNIASKRIIIYRKRKRKTLIKVRNEMALSRDKTGMERGGGA